MLVFWWSLARVSQGLRYIEDDRRVARQVVGVAGRGVDEENLAVRADSVTFMYVSVHVVLWLDPPLNGVKQLHTAGSNPCAAEIPEAQRWGVGDEDIRVCGHLLPPLETLLAPGKVEGPATELRLPGGAIYFDALYEYTGVLQVGAVGQFRLYILSLTRAVFLVLAL